MEEENGEEALKFIRLPDNEKFVFLYTELRWIGKVMGEILQGQKGFKKIIIRAAIGMTLAVVGAVLSYHIWPR